MSRLPEPAEDAPLPDDVALLKALLLAERASAAKLAGHNEQLRAIIKELQRALFGRRSEKAVDPDQLLLALQDLEQALAEGEAAAEKSDATLPASRRRPRRVNRGALPRHLPREEVLIEPESTICPCCQGALHRIGEDVAERLDVIPAQFRVVVTRRPKYGCRACESAVVQAPAPARLIEGGLPTEALVAQVLVAKYADHLPLYRQSQIYARQGIELDRSRGAGGPRPATSGRSRATTGPGPAPIRLPWPTSMHPAAAPSMRSGHSQGSAAFSRSMPMRPTMRSPIPRATAGR
jgi:transposase